MDQINYKTTWAQAQRLLIENPQFAEDKTLQSKRKVSEIYNHNCSHG